MKLREWNARLHGLVVFRSLLDDPVVAKLLDLTDRMEAGAPGYGPVCDAVAQFEAALFEHTTNWGSYLSAAVLEAETVCVRQAASGTLAPALQTALDSELAFLQALCGLTLDELLAAAGSATGQAQELAFLPRWETADLDLPAAYAQRMSEVGKKGYGMFAKHHVFTVENGKLVPVKYPDPQRLSELPGYEKEREKVIANTRALLAGMPANNVLLYGDAGTGKSSSVKAIANEFAPEGLRLVEVKKNQLYQIPDLMDKLAANPLKFILFIDDLSFTANDDNFAALKAILEGSVGGRARNIAVYATSNRRHLIKETLTDRSLLDMEHIWDFANTVDVEDVRSILEPQIRCNMAIAEEGLRGNYGANIGSVLLDMEGNDVRVRAKAYAAAGSDARMNGCEQPVVINSGSGNQGITTSVPVIVYAQELGVSDGKLLRALTLSNLTTIHEKTPIGRLSAYCGAISAGAGAGAGIAYLCGGDYDAVIHTVVNALAVVSGVICDGAKASCAAKIATAVEAGLLGYNMYIRGNQFRAGDGIVAKGVENSLRMWASWQAGHEGDQQRDH